MKMLYAVVRGARDEFELDAYLPPHWEVVGDVTGSVHLESTTVGMGPPTLTAYVISGQEKAGWTFDGYLAPRLASGSMAAQRLGDGDPLIQAAWENPVVQE